MTPQELHHFSSSHSSLSTSTVHVDNDICTGSRRTSPGVELLSVYLATLQGASLFGHLAIVYFVFVVCVHFALFLVELYMHVYFIISA